MNKQHNIPRKPLTFLLYIAAMKKWWVIATLIMVTLATSTSLAVTYVSKLLVDAIEQGIEEPKNIWSVVAIMGGLYLLINPLWRASGMFGSVASEGGWKVSYDLLFCRLIHHSDKYFQDRFAGAVTNKIHHVAHGVFEIFTNTFWGVYPGILNMVLAMVLVSTESLLIGGLFFLWIVLFSILARYLLPKKRILSYKESKLYSKLRGISVDIVGNASSVRQFVGQEKEINNIALQSKRVYDAGIKSWWYGEFLRFSFMLMNHGITIGVLVLGVFLWLDGQVSAGDMLLFYWLAEKLSETLREMGNNFDSYMKNFGEIDEGLEELLVDYDLLDAPGAQNIKVSSGKIDFQNVKFLYGSMPVFTDLSIQIPGGQKVGLIGESGAGKSTLVQLLLRQYDVQGGAILFDDQNISQMTQDSIRASIAYIPQDPSLFHRSIGENITYGKPDATQKEIEQAAKSAHAHEFIKTLEKGYDTLVGERGIKLSGGQRQRVIIARAILKDAPILILDEATSALDSESEQKIQQALVELMKGKTVIAIAHRLSTIKHLDRILVLKQGKVIEDGSHDQLQKKGGRYADLWSHQVDGFIGD